MRLSLPSTLSASSPSARAHALVSLKGHEAFDGVFKQGVRFAHRGMTGFVRFRTADASQQTQTQTTQTILFGVTAKKRTRPAVLRNRIKRLLRESLRRAFAQMSARQRAEAFAAIDAIVLICNAIPERAAMIGLEHTAYPVERIIKDALRARQAQFQQSHQQLRQR
jgi:ribonuclease P protein component